MVKPPIQVFGIEGRYACALYSAASKTKSLDAVEKDLNNFQNNFKKDAKLRDFILNPTIKRNVKAAALKDVAAKVNFSTTTGFFLETLAENGRLNKLDNVINAFKLIMSAARGEVVCEVITAKPLDGSQRKELEAQLKVSYLLISDKNYADHFRPLPEIHQVKREHPSDGKGRPSHYWRYDCVNR